MAGCIDLHSHTTESDGTFSPAELVQHAKNIGLDALAITDHDTFSGYELAAPIAKSIGLDLVRGIELNGSIDLEGNDSERGNVHRSVHLLAYFPTQPPSEDFNGWLSEQRDERRTRNRRLAEALQQRNVNVTVEEVEARGKTLAGRTHFAQLLMEKGYASDWDDAFRKYLGENAPSFVERQSPTADQVIAVVRKGGGIPVVAHPVRLSLSHELERKALKRLRAAGLLALEVYHSDQSEELQTHYATLAKEFDLLESGGSDFHGAIKKDVNLGTGRHDNIRVPHRLLDAMRKL